MNARGVFEVDPDQVIPELEQMWVPAGYHGFGCGDGQWSAISSGGEVLTGDTPDTLNQAIRAHWQAMQ